MSISLDTIRLMVRFLKQAGLRGGAVLTYGVQGVQGTYEDLLACLVQENFSATPLEPSEIRMDADTGEFGHSLHADTLFKALGFTTVESLDVYPDERPTHVANLNEPLPPSLYGRYDWVVDGGTLEHCFNTGEALFNTARLLKPGGWVLHMNPVSGMVNHGFYQFSPTLYFDFYSENGFDDLAMRMMLPDSGRVLTFDPGYVFNDFLGEQAISFFTARKRETVDALRMPIQNVYREKFGAMAVSSSLQAFQAIGRQMPPLSAWKDKIPSRRLLRWLLRLRKWQQLQKAAQKI